ncbi:MAG: hypothetical protein FWH51_06190 [Dehalococcoidia bacterium]|nr:hypothetical protein [Dehalococcoidia bacterium]
MLKNIVKCSLLALCLLLSACDASLEIIGMEICAYPNKTVYVAGIDNSLDLTGGTVTYLLKGGAKSEDKMDESWITVTHDIDFNSPGIYTVTLVRHKGICQFSVHVVTPCGYTSFIIDEEEICKMLPAHRFNKISYFSKKPIASDRLSQPLVGEQGGFFVRPYTKISEEHLLSLAADHPSLKSKFRGSPVTEL